MNASTTSSTSPGSETASQITILGAAYGLADVTERVTDMVDTSNSATPSIDATNANFGDTWTGVEKTLTIVYRYQGGAVQTKTALENGAIDLTAAPPPSDDAPAGGRSSPEVSAPTRLTVLGSTFGTAEVTPKVISKIDSQQALSFTPSTATFPSPASPPATKAFVLVYCYDGLPITLVVPEGTAIAVQRQGFGAAEIATVNGRTCCRDANGNIWVGGSQAWTRVNASHSVLSVSAGMNNELWCVSNETIGVSLDHGRSITTRYAGAPVLQVSASADGAVWGRLGDLSLIRLVRESEEWVPQAAELIQIAVASKTVQWGLDRLNQIQRQDATPGWQVVIGSPGGQVIMQVSAVGPAAEDFLFAVTFDGALHLLAIDGNQNWSWTQIGNASWRLLGASVPNLVEAWGISWDHEPVYIGGPSYRGASADSIAVAPPSDASSPGRSVEPAALQALRARLAGGPAREAPGTTPSELLRGLLPGPNCNYQASAVSLGLDANGITQVFPDPLVCNAAGFIDWPLQDLTNTEVEIRFPDAPTGAFQGPLPVLASNVVRFFNTYASSGQNAYLVNGHRRHDYDPSVDNQPTGACRAAARPR